MAKSTTTKSKYFSYALVSLFFLFLFINFLFFIPLVIAPLIDNPNIPLVRTPTTTSSSIIYHGMIDWIQAPVSVTLTGNNYCDQLDNQISGYAYTCQNCVNVATGGAVACSGVVSVLETCGCKVD